MGKNNPRSPEAKKQAAIWCAIAIIAVAVMMLMANPWKHQPATTAPQANSATQTQSDAKHKAKAKKKGKAASTSDSLEQKAQTMFTGDAEQISNDVRDLLNAPENSNVDTLSTLLYRHGRQDLAEATDLYDAIGQQKDNTQGCGDIKNAYETAKQLVDSKSDDYDALTKAQQDLTTATSGCATNLDPKDLEKVFGQPQGTLKEDKE